MTHRASIAISCVSPIRLSICSLLPSYVEEQILHGESLELAQPSTPGQEVA